MSSNTKGGAVVEERWLTALREANEKMRAPKRTVIAPKVNPKAVQQHKQQLKDLEGMSAAQARTNLAEVHVRTRGKRKRTDHQRRDLGSEFTKSIEWRRLRYAVLALFGNKCMCCGAQKGRIHVDHIQPRIKRPDLSLHLTNLQVMCEACNFGKGYRDSTDWRTEEQRISARNLEDKSLVAILQGKK